MDVEKTIEFILEHQAKTDTQLEAIRKMIRVGMRMIVRIGQAQDRTDQQIAKLTDSQARTDVKMAELADAQKVTEQKFQALLDILRENRNGHERSWLTPTAAQPISASAPPTPPEKDLPDRPGIAQMLYRRS